MRNSLFTFFFILSTLQPFQSNAQEDEAICSHQVVFLLDTSSSLLDYEFETMRESVNSMASLLIAEGFEGEIAIVQYGSLFNTCVLPTHQASVSVPFTTDANQFKSWPRIYGTNGLNPAFQNDHLTGSLATLRRRNAWSNQLALTADKVHFIVMTEAPPNINGSTIDNDPRDRFYDDCNGRTMDGFDEINYLKNEYAAEFIMVHRYMENEAAAVASVGGAYTGTVKASPNDPQGSMTIPRKMLRQISSPSAQRLVLNMIARSCLNPCGRLDPSFVLQPYCDEGIQKVNFRTISALGFQTWELYETEEYKEISGGKLIASRSGVYNGTFDWLGPNRHYYLKHTVSLEGCSKESSVYVEETYTKPEFHFSGSGLSNIFCPDTIIYMNGDNVDGHRYFISIQRRATGSTGPFQFYSEPGWQDDGTTFPMNLTQILADHNRNKSFQPGYDYKIKLAAINLGQCLRWASVEHAFSIIACRKAPAKSRITASPNPAHSFTRISLESDTEIVGEYRIYSKSGELMNSLTAMSNESIQIDVSRYQSDIYFYHFVSDGLVTEMQKLVVLH